MSVVEAGVLSVWEPASGSLLGRAHGGWVDGCLTPDGETVVVLLASFAGSPGCGCARSSAEHDLAGGEVGHYDLGALRIENSHRRHGCRTRHR